MDTQVADSLPGTLIDGRYRIRSRVARGGMATVYLATDERLERNVALKILHPTRATTDGQPAGFFERFSAEAKTIARLTHPNVVAVYDQGSYHGLPYVVMEYVRGRTLRDVLTERRRLNPAEALTIGEQMLAAVAAAHRAGLVHRDIKPENVLVAESPKGGAGNLVDSVVKVADFGLARAIEAGEDTRGQMHATVAYVAPELVAQGHADARTDVYSAGIVLFEMLTGRVPYDGDEPARVAWQHVDNDVPPPSALVPGLPAALDDLVVRATRRDPAVRPTDAGALLSEVQGVRDDLGNANAHTALLRQVPQQAMAVAQPTMVVASVPPAQHDDRPSWARLPHKPESRSTTYGGTSGQDGSTLTRAMGEGGSRWALIAALVALGLLVAVGGWWIGVGRYTEAPPLVNLTKAEAESRAAQAGLSVKIAEQAAYDDKVAKDSVLRQDPAANARMVKGGTVTLTLSLGPARFEVPDVVGQTYDLAAAELTKLNLKPKRGPDRFNNDYPAGVVVSVTPAAGEVVKPGDTVTLTVSKGKAPITVPNVIGKNIAEARAELGGLGLVVSETYVDSDKPRDEVLDQNPPDGSGAEQGNKIELKVSKGPPAVVLPRVIDMSCGEARQTLEGMGLGVQAVPPADDWRVVHQSPEENSEVPPGSTVTIVCTP